MTASTDSLVEPSEIVTSEPLAAVPPRVSMLAPIKIRNFRYLWFGEGTSTIGDQFHFIALSWLVLQLTGSGLALGTVLLLGGIPRAIFMLVGGAFSDRFAPRTIMMVSNAIRGALTGLIAALVLTDSIQMWHLYGAALLFGVADAFFFPAFRALLPRIIDDDLLDQGNAVLQFTLRGSVLFGPLLAGIIVAKVSIGAAFAWDTFTFGISLLMLTRIHIAPTAEASADTQSTEKSQQPSIFASIGEALRYAWHDPLLRLMLILVAAIDFSFGGAVSVGLPVLADARFTAEAFGLMVSAFGAGSIIGILLAGTVQFSRRGLLFIGLMVMFSASFVMLTIGGVLAVFVAAVGVSGIASGIFNVTGISWLQKRTDPAMLGRVMSLVMLSSVGLQPLSNGIAGLLAKIDLTLLFGGGAAIIIAGTLLAATSRELWSLR